MIQLKKSMKKTFPTLAVDFFVLQRNRYVYMGLNRPLHYIENFAEVLQFIENLWNEKKNKDDLFIFCRYPEIMHLVKWRYDHLLTQKKFFLDVVAIPFKRISSNTKVLLKAFPTSAGYDLFAAERKVIAQHGRELIKPDLCLEIAKGYYGKVVGKSGLAIFKGILVFNGTVDSEYRGNICAVLFNFGNLSYVVEIGNRVGQFMVEKRNDIKFVGYHSLSDSDRSNNGFGSTLGF